VSNYLTYLSLAVTRALAIRADVILSMTDPPIMGLAGAFVSKLSRRPFVYNIRDLYPDMALGSQIVRPSHWVEGWEKLHRRALRRASRVIVLGEDMRDRIVAKGVDPARVVIVRDGAQLPESLPPADHPAAQEIRCGFPFVLLHAGNLGFYGAWETLNSRGETPRKRRHWVGLRRRWSDPAADRSLRRRLPCGTVSALPPAAASALRACGRGPTRGHGQAWTRGVVVPSKLYPILAAGRAVLAVAPEETDVARIVRRTGCGGRSESRRPGRRGRSGAGPRSRP